MGSKRTKESSKDKSIHRTVKNKSVGGKEKISKTGKTTNLKRSSNETSTTSKSTQSKEKQTANKDTQNNLKSGKPSNEKTLILDEDDQEGMTVPPKEEIPSSPWSQGPRPEPEAEERPTAGPARAGPARAPPPRRPTPKPAPAPAPRPTKRPPPPKSPTRHKKEESSEDEEGEEDSPVKQFSFPAYKILSGASVAPVQMFPQKVVIKQSDEPARSIWGSALTGLFQNSKLTLKLRMLRLFLIWVFFRVLNKQTAWLSDMLGIGIPDEEPASGPKVKPPPGERFIKVFREGDPNPFHVRVKRPL